MTLAEVLAAARAAGVTLWADGDALRYRGPRAALTAGFLDQLKAHKPDLLAVLARPDPLPPVPRSLGSAELLDQILAHPDPRSPRGLGGYATPPGVPPLGDCELARQLRSMPEDDHVPGVAEDLDNTAAVADAALWWRVAILEPSGRTIEDTPSGWSLSEWAAYAERYHGPRCTVTPIAQLPKPRGPVNLDEVLAAACDAAAGVTPEVFRSLLSHEDLQDIEAGDIGIETLRGYALSFAEGLRSGAGRFHEKKISEICQKLTEVTGRP